MSDEISDLSSFPMLQTLSAALARVTGAYDEFCSRLSPDNAKDFIAHHNACKAALAHLGAIIKLHNLWQKNERNSNTDNNGELESLLRQARSVLLATDNHNDNQEDQL
jgi:hypothetical protein